MTHADTRAAILRGDYYERHVKPLCTQANRARAEAAARAAKAAWWNNRRRGSPQCSSEMLHQGRVLPEEIEAL